MPNLGDFLGQLMSEITIARMQADLEAVRVAELYASHPLLRHLAVPRFRLPQVDVDVPVLIEEMEEPREGESPRGGTRPAELRAPFNSVVDSFLAGERIAPNAADRERLSAALDHAIARLSGPSDVAVDVHGLADGLTNTVFDTLPQLSGLPRSPLSPQRLAELRASLRDAVRSKFLGLRSRPPRLGTVVTTAAIRDARSPDGLTRLKLSISEEAVEWAIGENNADGSRLVPE